MTWVRGFPEVASRRTDRPRSHGGDTHSSSGPHHHRLHTFHVPRGVSPSGRDFYYFLGSAYGLGSDSDLPWSVVSPERSSSCRSSSSCLWTHGIRSAILCDPSSSSVPWIDHVLLDPWIGSRTSVLSDHLAFVPWSRLPSSGPYLQARTLSSSERRSLLP